MLQQLFTDFQDFATEPMGVYPRLAIRRANAGLMCVMYGAARAPCTLEEFRSFPTFFAILVLVLYGGWMKTLVHLLSDRAQVQLTHRSCGTPYQGSLQCWMSPLFHPECLMEYLRFTSNYHDNDHTLYYGSS